MSKVKRKSYLVAISSTWGPCGGCLDGLRGTLQSLKTPNPIVAPPYSWSWRCLWSSGLVWPSPPLAPASPCNRQTGRRLDRPSSRSRSCAKIQVRLTCLADCGETAVNQIYKQNTCDLSRPPEFICWHRCQRKDSCLKPHIIFTLQFAFIYLQTLYTKSSEDQHKNIKT